MKTSDTVQFKTDNEEKKSFSYYMPLFLSALIVLIIVVELTNHELIEKVIVQLFMSEK